MLIDSFQSSISLHHSVLLINSTFSSNNFDTFSPESVNLIEQSHLSDSDSSHQSDSEYHSDSNTSVSFTHINITKKVSHNSELSEPHISMVNNNNNNNNNNQS